MSLVRTLRILASQRPSTPSRAVAAPVRVRRRRHGQVPVTWLDQELAGAATIVHLHGGGFVSGPMVLVVQLSALESVQNHLAINVISDVTGDAQNENFDIVTGFRTEIFGDYRLLRNRPGRPPALRGVEMHQPGIDASRGR